MCAIPNSTTASLFPPATLHTESDAPAISSSAPEMGLRPPSAPPLPPKQHCCTSSFSCSSTQSPPPHISPHPPAPGLALLSFFLLQATTFYALRLHSSTRREMTFADRQIHFPSWCEPATRPLPGSARAFAPASAGRLLCKCVSSGTARSSRSAQLSSAQLSSISPSSLSTVCHPMADFPHCCYNDNRLAASAQASRRPVRSNCACLPLSEPPPPPPPPAVCYHSPPLGVIHHSPVGLSSCHCRLGVLFGADRSELLFTTAVPLGLITWMLS